MDIRIDNSSEVPIRHQLAEQIVFLIATNRLAAGEALPSVREMARRLKIHHNTVSDAYQDLVRRNWLARRRGSRSLGDNAAACHRTSRCTFSKGPPGCAGLILYRRRTPETYSRSAGTLHDSRCLRQQGIPRRRAKPPRSRFRKTSLTT